MITSVANLQKFVRVQVVPELKTYYTIYRVTNLINGMWYYGQHKTRNLMDYYLGGGTDLHKAYREFGKENFIYEIMFIYGNFKDMDDKEREVVEYDNPMTYNKRGGGHKGEISEVSKLLMSESAKNRPPMKQSTKEKLRLLMIGENNHNYQKPLGELTRKKISMALSGDKSPFFGKEPSEKTKKKQRRLALARPKITKEAIIKREITRKINKEIRQQVAIQAVYPIIQQGAQL